MTLLSFIAIITTVILGLGWRLSLGIDWKYADTNTPVWKKNLWKFLRWFDIDEAPALRRLLLKILGSVLFLIPLACGFWDTYTATEEHGFFYGLIAFVVSLSSLITLLLIIMGVTSLKELISFDYFNIGWSTSKITVLNIAILCIFTAMFIWFICLGDEHTFALISISGVITAIICLLLTIAGGACWAIYKIITIIIIRPLKAYITWLLK